MSQIRIVGFIIRCLLLVNLAACDKPQSTIAISTKEHLLSLEKKWLTAEFALDTTYLSSIIDTSFIDISGSKLHNKSEALANMYANISTRIADSILIDSFNLENPVVNVYRNSAVVTFIVHTYRKDKGISSEHRTRFYDVWIKTGTTWMAVASQGTPID